MLFLDLNNCVFHPAPTDSHRLAVPYLDTLADQNAHLRRQNLLACFLHHLCESCERACHCWIRSCPGQIIRQFALWNEFQRVSLLDMADKPFARGCAKQATRQSLKSRWQSKGCIAQEHIDHAVDVL